MKVLFLYKTKKHLTCDCVYKNLRDKMLACGYSVSDDVGKCTYNLIVALGTEKLNEAFRIKKELNIPVIFVFCKSDMKASYQIALEKVDYVIMYADKVCQTFFPLNKRCHQLRMPVMFEHISVESQQKKLPANKIYVHIDEKYFNGLTTIKLFRILNQLTQYDIKLHTPSKDLAKFLNSNIKLSAEANFKENIHQADIVIGSGYVLLYALLNKKHGIVIGERGYGGIVSNDTIEKHYHNFFQGRIGGKYDEPIPERLLFEDISSISNGVCPQDDLLPILSGFAEENQYVFSQIVENVVSKHSRLQTNKLNTPLIFNSDFTILQSGNRYWVIDRYIRQIHGWIDEKQYALIDKFIDENTIKKVFRDIPQGEQKQLLKFIDEMIEKKILTIFI